MVRQFIKKRGLSPIITTLILVALVIVIISIIFFWFRGMVQEGVTKFGKNIQLVCEEVDFDATYNSGDLNIVNNGNVPIYNMNLKISDGGSYNTESLNNADYEDWPATGLKQGEALAINIGAVTGTIELNPVLIGTSRSGKKTFVCGGQYGQQITA